MAWQGTWHIYLSDSDNKFVNKEKTTKEWETDTLHLVALDDLRNFDDYVRRKEESRLLLVVELHAGLHCLIREVDRATGPFESQVLCFKDVGDVVLEGGVVLGPGGPSGCDLQLENVWCL